MSYNDKFLFFSHQHWFYREDDNTANKYVDV